MSKNHKTPVKAKEQKEGLNAPTSPLEEDKTSLSSVVERSTSSNSKTKQVDEAFQRYYPKKGGKRLLILFFISYLALNNVFSSLRKVILPESRLWYDTYPVLSTFEWMNATAYEQASPTSGVMKTMIYPRPVRGKNQVLVRVVKAAGNPVDFKMRKNPFWPLKVLPAIPGYDFAGYVVSVDDDSVFKVGDRILGMLPTVSGRWGTFAEYVVINEEFTAVIPEGISFTEAAATPLAALTAIQALAALGPVTENQTVLIHAGSGGVGSFLIQFAKKILKLQVHTTSTNMDLCKSLGADRVINYKQEDFAKYRYDFVIDLIGNDYLFRGVPITKKHYVNILNNGWADYFGFDEMIPIGEGVTWTFLKLRYLLTFGMYPNYDLILVKSDGAALRVIMKLIKEGTIKVLLDNEYVGLDEGARKCLDRIQSRRAKGKVTLSLE